MGGGLRLASLLVVLGQVRSAVPGIRAFGPHLELLAHHHASGLVVRVVRAILCRVHHGFAPANPIVLIKYGATVMIDGLFLNL